LPGYELGGRRFESFRARHYRRKGQRALSAGFFVFGACRPMQHQSSGVDRTWSIQDSRIRKYPAAMNELIPVLDEAGLEELRRARRLLERPGLAAQLANV